MYCFVGTETLWFFSGGICIQVIELFKTKALESFYFFFKFFAGKIFYKIKDSDRYMK